jgi:hypothetical protein
MDLLGIQSKKENEMDDLMKDGCKSEGIQKDRPCRS